MRAEVTVERVSGTRVSFDTVCRLVAPPHTRLVEPSGGEAGVTVVDGKALALMQGWSPDPNGDDGGARVSPDGVA